jgi:hypothetical protein
LCLGADVDAGADVEAVGEGVVEVPKRAGGTFQRNDYLKRVVGNIQVD